MQRVTTDKYWVLSGTPEAPRLVRSNSDSWGKAHKYIGDYSQGRGRPRHRTQLCQDKYHKQKMNYHSLHPHKMKDYEGEEGDKIIKSNQHLIAKNNTATPLVNVLYCLLTMSEIIFCRV